MWHSVSRVLSEHFGESYAICDKEALSEGDIHHVRKVSNGDTAVFVKYNRRDMLSVFIAEAEQLNFLARSKTVKTPEVYGVGTSRNHSFLLLEYLPIKPLDPHSAYCLGQKLAKLHQWIDQPQFGLDFDNDLNTITQPNSWQRHWHIFFAEQRIGWQLQLAAEKDIQFGHIDKIIQAVSDSLKMHHPQPSLLHGDLWPANCGISGEIAIVFDPACYWGDRECDLAMLPLYSELPAQIYDGYQSIWPLPSDFIERQSIYQLYYLLNRANLYSGEHTEIAMDAVNRFMLTRK